MISRVSIMSKYKTGITILLKRVALLSVLLLLSCGNEMNGLLQPSDTDALRFVVSEFPLFCESDKTRVIGTQDAGKTAWADNDVVFVTLSSEKYGVQTVELKYLDGVWQPVGDVGLYYLSGESPEVTAVYAPCCKLGDDGLVVDERIPFGMDEYLVAECNIDADVLIVNFANAGRNYSRLRIATIAGQEITVATVGFTPAAPDGVTAPVSYNLTADSKGNAYLYGLFVQGGMVDVNNGETTYIFENATEARRSYALDALPVKDGKTIVFVEGVSREAGWYDVNKVGKGENGDINMCWAASSANIIEWWQDIYVSKGGILPSGAVSGPGKKYELALMELFHEQWNNEKGGHVVEAVPWYFEGVNYGEHAAAGSQAYPLAGYAGGFYKSIWPDVYPHLYHGYSYMFGWYENLYVGDFNNYYLWGDGSELTGKERLRYFTQLVVESIDRGIASLTVSLSPNLQTLHHATTIWGYEIDNTTGLLTRLWITDSDDLEKEPKQPLLNEYEVSIGDGYSHVKLSSESVRYGACYAVSLTPVSGYKIQ